MSYIVGPYSVEEHSVRGETLWMALRARGAEWSSLTPEEAAAIGRSWVERYGPEFIHVAAAPDTRWNSSHLRQSDPS